MFKIKIKSMNPGPNIYYDPNLKLLHEPNFGSIENGKRVDFDVSSWDIIHPNFNSVYIDFLKKTQ